MFDDTSTELGKLHRGFLTDDRGRRIYFPPFGPARWVPSPDREKAFKERVAVWMTIAFILAIVTIFILIVAIEANSSAGNSVLIVLAGRLLGECLLVRRWPQMDDPSITYERVVTKDLLLRSGVRLCVQILMYVLGAIACLAIPVVGFLADWSERSAVEVILSLYVSAVFCVLAAAWCVFQASRVIGVLRLKLAAADVLPS